MGYRDFSCSNDNPEARRQHDRLHAVLADVPRAQAAEEIIGVFYGAQTHAFGLNREQLVEAFRSMFVDAEDRKIEYLILSLLQPERFAYLAEMQTAWAKGYARAVANGEVRV
jgi:hypothetical protein